MNNWRVEPDQPIGMIRHDELLHILEGLQMTGACDPKTLAIVAHQAGLGKWFNREGVRIQVIEPLMIEAKQ